jgi:hypothetical protein
MGTENASIEKSDMLYKSKNNSDRVDRDEAAKGNYFM